MRQPLTGVEWITLWYSLNNEVGSECDACLINEVVTEYYNRLDDNQCQLLVNEMRSRCPEPNPVWGKFIAAFDRANHEKAEVNGHKVTVFRSGDKLYQLKDYISKPHEEIYLEQKQEA